VSRLVFRLEAPARFDPPAPAGLEFRLLAGPLDWLRLRSALGARLGRSARAKALAKLATPSRALYCVLDDGAIVHHGWLLASVGQVVIGPIATAEAARDRGAATYGLQRAIDAMAARGHRVFEISAAPGNAASLRVIEKCGFTPAGA
jgi:GNAT superfamily N-acetyltransferase